MAAVLFGVGARGQTIVTIAGGGPSGIPAVQAGFYNPVSVVGHSAGNIYFVDGHDIASDWTSTEAYKVDTSGTVTIVAGVSIDDLGDLFIANPSSGGNVIREVYCAAAGASCRAPGKRLKPGDIETVAGGGTGCAAQTDGVGDGCTAISATPAFPSDVRVDGQGDLLIADRSNDRVREVTGLATITSVAVSPASIKFGGQQVSTTSSPQIVTLLNNGNTPAAVPSVSLSDSADFNAASGCPTTAPGLQPRASCTISVTFTRQTTGNLSSTLTVTDTAGTQTVSLSGRGASH